MDVKTTFLYGELEEVIYMRQPEGYEAKGKKDHACKLNKSFFKDTLSYGCKPGVVSFTTLIERYSKRGDFRDALECLKEMMEGVPRML